MVSCKGQLLAAAMIAMVCIPGCTAQVCSRNIVVGDIEGGPQVRYVISPQPDSKDDGVDICWDKCFNDSILVQGAPCRSIVYQHSVGVCYFKTIVPDTDTAVNESKRGLISGWCSDEPNEEVTCNKKQMVGNMDGGPQMKVTLNPRPGDKQTGIDMCWDRCLDPAIRIGGMPCVSFVYQHGSGRCFLKNFTPLDGTATAIDESRTLLTTAWCAEESPAPLDCDSVWTQGNVLPREIAEVTVGVIDGKLYAIGLFDTSTMVYNIATDTWRADLAKRQYQGNHHNIITVNGKMYLLGGLQRGSGTKTQIYDPVADEWTLGADLPITSGSGASGFDGVDTIYTCSGISIDVTIEACAAYTISTDTWELLPEESNYTPGRNHVAYGTIGNLLYSIGGRSGDNGLSSSFTENWAFDMTTRRWTAGPPIPFARGGSSGVTYDNKFFIFAGELRGGECNYIGDYIGIDRPGIDQGLCTYTSAMVYIPGAAIPWMQIPDVPDGRHGVGAVEHEGIVYLVGGGDEAGATKTNTIFRASLDDLYACRTPVPEQP